MTRKLLALVLLAWLTPAAKSQDMPLSQILIDGESWKKGEKATAEELKSLQEAKHGFDVVGVSAVVMSPDQKVIYVAIENWTHVNAFQAEGPTDTRFWGQNQYCPLRLKRGEKTGGATALTVDKEGRIYAATPIGVQVFDPTGRLCGVLTPAAPGKSEFLAFEGDQLTLWIGDTKYTRKLHTTGAK